jgi:hypothetical protein
MATSVNAFVVHSYKDYYGNTQYVKVPADYQEFTIDRTVPTIDTHLIGQIAGVILCCLLPFSKWGRIGGGLACMACTATCAEIGRQLLPYMPTKIESSIHKQDPILSDLLVENQKLRETLMTLSAKFDTKDSTPIISQTPAITKAQEQTSVTSVKPLESLPPTLVTTNTAKQSDITSTSTKPLEAVQKGKVYYVRSGAKALAGIASFAGASFIAKTVFSAAVESIGLPSTLLATATIILVGGGTIRYYNSTIKV